MKRIPEDGTGCLCELCGKPVRRGQFVNVYDDVGEAHLDCERPYALPKALTPAPQGDAFMPTFVLLGDPMLLFHVYGVEEAVSPAGSVPAQGVPGGDR